MTHDDTIFTSRSILNLESGQIIAIALATSPDLGPQNVAEEGTAPHLREI